jgi:hypothetical protein
VPWLVPPRDRPSPGDGAKWGWRGSHGSELSFHLVVWRQTPLVGSWLCHLLAT